jgi:hypothetical protein
MKNIIFFAIMVIVLSGCSKNLIPYTVGIEKKIKGQETAVQYYASSDLTLTLADYQDTLLVNQKGEIERQKSSETTTFFVKSGTQGVLEKVEEGIYWIRFDSKDDRLVPFIPVGIADPSGFSLAMLPNGRVLLSDQKEYVYRGAPNLRVSQKVISKMTQEAKKAKGVKIGR